MTRLALGLTIPILVSVKVGDEVAHEVMNEHNRRRTSDSNVK